MVEIWAEPLQKRYSNSRFSLAWIFWLGFYIAILLIPWFVGYATNGFWIKQAVYREQPRHTFEHRVVVTLEGTSGGAPLLLSWSTMPQYNALLSPGQLRLSQVASSATDSNHDGVTDAFSINITTPLLPGEEIYQATAWTFFYTELDDIVSMQMFGMAVFSGSTPVPAARVTDRAGLFIDFTVPVPAYRTRRTYNTQILPPASLQSVSDILPDNVYQQVLMRNETLQLVRRVPTVWTPVSGAAAEFTTSLAFSVPVQEILYKPGVAETLKFAWVQYLSLLLLLYFFADYARAYVYRYQLVDTYVASDTRPPQKVHQF